MSARWLPIPGYEGRYSVSDEGDVRNDVTGRILQSQTSTGNEYPRVWLGAGNEQYVHHLVALVFIGPRPDGLDVLHANDIPADCRVTNLSYGTASKNISDASDRGRLWQNTRTHCPRNHPYDEQNTYRNARGYRWCRACRRQRYHERKAAA